MIEVGGKLKVPLSGTGHGLADKALLVAFQADWEGLVTSDPAVAALSTRQLTSVSRGFLGGDMF